MTGMAIVQVCAVALLAALVQAQSDGCYDAMKCVTTEARNAVFSKNKPELCRLLPGILECAERENAQCDDKNMSTRNALQIAILSTSAKACDKILATATAPVTVKQCSEQFRSCLPHEFERTSEQRNEESICNAFPTIFDCLETALSMCPRTEDQQVEKMSAQLEKMRNDSANSQCALSASGDSFINNSANSVVTSIIQTCIALILATLLH